jgi:hypothetical protein
VSRAFTGQRSTVFFTSWASKSPHSHQEGGREEHDDYQRGEIGEIACHSERQFDGVVGAPAGRQERPGNVQGGWAFLNADDAIGRWLTNTCG